MARNPTYHTYVRGWGSKCVAWVSQDVRNVVQQTRELRQPGVAGIFLGFQHVWGKTHAVLIDEPKGTLMHTRSAAFDLENPDFSELHPERPRPRPVIELDIEEALRLEEARPAVSEQPAVSPNPLYDASLSPSLEQSVEPEPARYPPRERAPPRDIYKEAIEKEQAHKDSLQQIRESVHENVIAAEHEEALLCAFMDTEVPRRWADASPPPASPSPAVLRWLGRWLSGWVTGTRTR